MRKYIDCRDYPSEKACSLYLSGTEDEVLQAAYDHAIHAHDELPSDQLRDQLKAALRDEAEPGRRELETPPPQPPAFH